MKKRELTLNLQLFDGEGGSASAGSAPAAGAGTGAETTPSAAGKGRANDLANVVYGKQETQVQESTGQQAAAAVETIDPEARRAEFERLINDEYHDLYTERTQNIAKERVRNMKTMEKNMERMSPIMESLASRYGVKDATDYDGIMKAMEEDDGFFEDAAAAEGLTVEQYKRMQKLERENAHAKAARQQQERQQQQDQVWADWMQQAEQVKAMYPGFNLQRELDNADFGRMLGAGVSVKAAFEALHHEEIMAGAMQYTAKTIAKKTADGIASRNNRPVENGLGAQASANVRADVSKLTKADRAEIARRVARGERIVF